MRLSSKAGEKLGLPEKAPFDKILVSAGDMQVPDDLIEQLKPGGTMVIPVRDAIHKITKRTDGSLDTETHEGFVFVPLIH